MGKFIGQTVSSIGSIGEGVKKKKDGKAFIAQAKQRQRNFEETDISTNAFANIKASDEGTKLALEGIAQAEASTSADASGAGIRGIGMINLIQQNTNKALALEAAKLSEKQSRIDVASGGEQGRIRDINVQRDIAEQARTDQMLERGQALRSQGTAEIGSSAEALGTAIDESGKDVVKAFKDIFIGGSGFGGSQGGTV